MTSVTSVRKQDLLCHKKAYALGLPSLVQLNDIWMVLNVRRRVMDKKRCIVFRKKESYIGLNQVLIIVAQQRDNRYLWTLVQ